MGIAYLDAYKQPSEELLRYVDFVDRIAAGDSIASCIISATDEDGADAPTVIYGPSAIVDAKVYYTIKGGTHGSTYKYTFRAVSNANAKVEEDLIVSVREY